MFMTPASSKDMCRQQSVNYRQWPLVTQNGNLFRHIKGEENHDQDFGLSDSKRHDEVYDR